MNTTNILSKVYQKKITKTAITHDFSNIKDIMNELGHEQWSKFLKSEIMNYDENKTPLDLFNESPVHKNKGKYETFKYNLKRWTKGDKDRLYFNIRTGGKSQTVLYYDIINDKYVINFQMKRFENTLINIFEYNGIESYGKTNYYGY